MLQLSIVMPAHNEAANIEGAVAEWFDEVVDRIPGTELIVVDDCSTDDTGERLAALAARLPTLRALRTPVNAGHGPAVRFGLEHSRGAFVFQTDSDRQHRASDFWALWALRDEVDFAFGVREHRADGPFRLLVSHLLRGLNLLLWQRWIRDANCPFKLMRRAPLEAVLAEIPRSSFIPMVMIAVLARHHGYRVREVVVPHFARAAGEQSLTGVLRWSRIGPRCARELLALRASLGRPTAHVQVSDDAPKRPDTR